MVTAELAVAIPALVLVLAVTLSAVALGIDRVRCVDAARIGARALARGDATGPAMSSVGRAAPSGARVSSGLGAAQVAVTVGVHRSLPLVGWGVDVSATAVADLELVSAPGGGGGS